ncbi:hypothetical protein [Cytobacillus sp. IB215316]|uniref:hypothetical protein n=1 Tax=Cytobacillus sp. IB215316 TaxID=3097354 RepID=UPI002A0DDD22|nr:hypothetical protein [Cytobacillus sp. IB215316]MDX8361408.1 hypothetical protein [Cytobacillus sp. IB215316]
MEELKRFLQLDKEWNVVHIPYKPNGFGVFVIGDKNHYVDQQTSFWMQNMGRSLLLDSFSNNGYTVFYSNLYNEHWGSPKALLLAKRLYHIIMRKEILNKRIHVLAEGMGALVALQLMEDDAAKIRSTVLLNPCIDLIAQANAEKDNKFFYKRFLKEFAAAHDIDEKNAEVHLMNLKHEYKNNSTNIKIWQSVDNYYYNPMIHCRKYEKLRKSMSAPITLAYHLQEKRNSIAQSIIRFYRENEKVL